MPSFNPERRSCEARTLSALPFAESGDRRHNTVARLDLFKVRLLGSWHAPKQAAVHAAKRLPAAGCGTATAARREGFTHRANRLRLRRGFIAAQRLNARLELLDFAWKFSEVSENFALCDPPIGDQTFQDVDRESTREF